MKTHKWCWKCVYHKPLTEFYRCSRSKDGHRDMCRSCCKSYRRHWVRSGHNAAQLRAWRLRYPEKLAAQRERFYARRRERAVSR